MRNRTDLLGMQSAWAEFMTRGLFIVCLLAAIPALASDGVAEINQACALQGCFPGDAPGFPVTVSQGGSYQLTSNLMISDPNDTAIAITAVLKPVTIDLNGFLIQGVTFCSGIPPTCSNTGIGAGVVGGSDEAVTVRNGTIRGMGDDGVQVSSYSLVENLNVAGNGGDGVQCGAACVVRGNRADFNGGSGIVAATGSVVSGNTTFRNAGYGLSVPNAGYVQNAMSFDALGSVSGGTQLGSNLCGFALCP